MTQLLVAVEQASGVFGPGLESMQLRGYIESRLWLKALGEPRPQRPATRGRSRRLTGSATWTRFASFYDSSDYTRDSNLLGWDSSYSRASQKHFGAIIGLNVFVVAFVTARWFVKKRSAAAAGKKIA